MNKSLPKQITQYPSLLLVAAIVVIAMIVVLAGILPAGIDWHLYFRPAAIEFISLRTPYTVVGFPSPPWALIPIAPLALLPENIGRAAWLVLNLILFAIAIYRLGARRWAWPAFLLSPLVMHSLLNANLDSFILLGFTLPPQVGLFFVTLKPQMGSVVVIFWLIEAWRRGGWREVLRVFAPITIATLLSFVLYGLWIQEWLIEPAQWWNASLWPVSIPIGLALAVAAIRTRKIQFAMGASPLLSPYVLFHAWSGALAAIVQAEAETIAAVIGLWILVLIRAVN